MCISMLVSSAEYLCSVRSHIFSSIDRSIDTVALKANTSPLFVSFFSHSTMNTDPAFQQILDKIPERDQISLKNQHGITSLNRLIEMKSQVEQRQLDNVCTDVQFALEVVCKYLETLDGISSFSWEGFENFCGYTDNSGDYILDPVDEGATKKKVDPVDPDPEGYNLTPEERKQMEQNLEDDPLTLKISGFSPRVMQFEDDNNDKKKLVEDTSEKTQVTFNGSVFYVKNCYYHQQQNGETVRVGIIKFTRNEKSAICALVVPFQDTIMGPHLPEEPPIDVPATYEEDQTGVPPHVAVREKPGSEPIIPLSSLKPCLEPSTMPELLFERQRKDEPPHNFGFVYGNDGSNRGEERDEITFVDCFAGGGGFHHGLSQVPGLKGVAAVDWWERARETFERNNPETPFYYQKVEEFIGSDHDEFRARHGKVDFFTWSSPCQSFSGSNRDVDHNSEKDLYRKYLSVNLIDAMNVTGASIGVLENVEGMWRRPNIYFLKKIVLDAIKSGYQVRSRLYRAHVFGDPQARPRLLIFVAKKYVEMPNVIETHGPGKHSFVTAGNALNALDKFIKKSPELVPNLKGSAISRPDHDEILDLDKPAGTIRCGGRCWHPIHDRAINPREAATLQSFKYCYEFLGTITDQYKLVGNAVPGRMGAAIGRAVKESLRFVHNEELHEEEPEAEGIARAPPPVLEVDNNDEQEEADSVCVEMPPPSVLEVDNEKEKDQDVAMAPTPVLEAGNDVDGKEQKEAKDVETIPTRALELHNGVDDKQEQEEAEGPGKASSPVLEVGNGVDGNEEHEQAEGAETKDTRTGEEEDDDKEMQEEADDAEEEEKERAEACTTKKHGRDSDNVSIIDVADDIMKPAPEEAPTGSTAAAASSIDASAAAHAPSDGPAPPAEREMSKEQGTEISGQHLLSV